MLRTFAIALVFVTLSCCGYSSEPQRLAVLVYHHLQNKVTSDVSCTPEQFLSQMQALLAAGFTPINLAQTRRFLAGTLDDVRQPVLITFDDGYESLYQFALPVARQLEIPMTVFMITSRAGRRIQFAEYLTESQIREMVGSGYFDFGSHTHDLHTDTVSIYDAFAGHAENPVLRLLQRDLRMSASRLESVLGARPLALAWPYGKFNGEFSALARQSGFRLHFTSVHGYNEPGANPFAIKRIPVTSRDTAESVLRKASSTLR
ncbi:MAG: hypothetical protein CVV41_06595 [Candidatus Riflebacteria bacterium HGW-Riflebacteria-1]|nr:MAG: hypothetical protein CVV41_06595 [Candidatus Riflebacteria bacterium HGW-Riflebacteria-1]